MLGAEFGKLAEEYGMTRDQGVAYGIVNGYTATFLDGAGCHRMMLTTRFASNDDKDILMALINRTDLKNLYGIRKLQIAKKVVYILFRTGPDAVDKIRSFVEWFFPLLEEHGASKADVCVQCQQAIAEEDSHWVLRDGATAFRMHHACAEELKASVGSDKKNVRAKANGSVVKGLLGSLLGAVLGAVLWAALELIQFYSAIAGLAVGWLVVYFYGKFGGKSCKLRLPLLIFTGLLSVALGVFLSALVTASDKALFLSSLSNAELWGSMLEVMAPGLLFAALGLFVALKSESRRTADMVVTDLK